MSVLYDKKLIIHVSLEIVLMGSMAYFFHNRSKAFENRLYDTETRLASLERQLITQKEELQLVKKMKQTTPIPTPILSSASDNEFKAFKKFQEEQARIAQTVSEPTQKFVRPVFTPATVEVIEVDAGAEEEDPLQLSLTITHPPSSPTLTDLDKEIESELNELNELI